jgi:hypothetical protein
VVRNLAGETGSLAASGLLFLCVGARAPTVAPAGEPVQHHYRLLGERKQGVAGAGRNLTNAQFPILIYHPKGSAIHHGNAMSENVARSDSARNV